MSVGFVPTMGALHSGHLELLAQANQHNDISVVSIFVNPRQFNDAADFDKYPRPLEQDILLLSQHDCDVLFLPENDEIYGIHSDIHPDLNGMDKVLEGEFRPGHFDGMLQIVYRLLIAVSPDNLYMGQKDFQQQALVGRMIKVEKLLVKLVTVPIFRESNGLAMSSRNVRLSAEMREKAGLIYATLLQVAGNIKNYESVATALNAGKEALELPHTRLEYLAYCSVVDLKPLDSYAGSGKGVLLVAIWWGDVRLIDNVIV
jgi:pantoate--beta-alanine ligase